MEFLKPYLASGKKDKLNLRALPKKLADKKLFYCAPKIRDALLFSEAELVCRCQFAGTKSKKGRKKCNGVHFSCRLRMYIRPDQSVSGASPVFHLPAGRRTADQVTPPA